MRHKHATEPTRQRPHGTHVTNPDQAADPGTARIEAIQSIVDRGQYSKVDGTMIDLFTAGAILSVYRAIRPNHQVRYREMRAGAMGMLAFKIINKQEATL